MSAMMDYVLSGVVLGVLVLILARLQININSTLSENTFNVRVQGNAVELARQIERDFVKMGFHVDPSSGNQITLADSKQITFKTDWDNTNNIVTMSYRAGDSTQATNTQNVHDFPLFRGDSRNTPSEIKQNWGLTQFEIAYYDSLQNKIPTPVSAANRLKIKAIQVWFTIQSPDPVISYVDTTWPAVTWQKMMFPRNLNRSL